MIFNAFLIAIREIRRNLTRSFLTVVGIVIGVAAVGVLGIVVEAWVHRKRVHAATTGSTIVIVERDESDDDEDDEVPAELREAPAGSKRA